MKIRAGYQISYECLQPTPMILTMSVHPTRRADLITPDQVRLHPKVPVREYSDGFSNICHVIRAPAGLMTISSVSSSRTAAVPTRSRRRPRLTRSTICRSDARLSARQPVLRDRPPV